MLAGDLLVLLLVILNTTTEAASFLPPLYLLSITAPSTTNESLSSTSTSTMNITNIIENLGVGGHSEKEEEVITPEMAQLSKEITEEEPKIEAALKNFMSILLAQSATGNAQAHRDRDDNFVPLTSDSVLRNVRLLIKKINTWVLPDLVQWGAIHPQNENEGAMGRLDALTRFKVLYALHRLALQKNAKPAKLFGVKFFHWSRVWPTLRDSILSENTSGSNHSNSSSGASGEEESECVVSSEEQCLRYILDKFEQSLSSGKKSFLLFIVDV